MMKVEMNKILLATIFSLLALVAGYEYNHTVASPQRNENNQFIIGILRADGTLVPFAQYGNGGWFNPWPKPTPTQGQSIYAENAESIRHSLGNLPEPWFKQCGKIPRTWYIWSSAGTPIPLTASKVVKVTGHSETNWALLTDFPKQTSEDGLDQNIGVAVSVNEKAEPMIEIKTTATVEAADIVPFIRKIFDYDETAEIDRIRAERPSGLDLSTGPFGLSKEERTRTGFSLVRLDRSKSTVRGEYLYYFRAEKQYEKRTAAGRPSCNDVFVLEGWITAHGKGGLGLLTSRLFLTDCDMKGPSITTPLGIMTLNKRTFLFVTEHGWEDVSYTILQLDNTGLHRVLATYGG